MMQNARSFPRQCSDTPKRFNNLALAWMDGGAVGAAGWVCCNCNRDKRPSSRLSSAGGFSLEEYNKKACPQCRARPPEVLMQMRSQVGNRTRELQNQPMTRRNWLWLGAISGGTVLMVVLWAVFGRG